MLDGLPAAQARYVILRCYGRTILTTFISLVNFGIHYSLGLHISSHVFAGMYSLLVKTQDGVLGLFRHGLTRCSRYRYPVIMVVPCESTVTISILIANVG